MPWVILLQKVVGLAWFRAYAVVNYIGLNHCREKFTHASVYFVNSDKILIE